MKQGVLSRQVGSITESWRLDTIFNALQQQAKQKEMQGARESQNLACSFLRSAGRDG